MQDVQPRSPRWIAVAGLLISVALVASCARPAGPTGAPDDGSATSTSSTTTSTSSTTTSTSSTTTSTSSTTTSTLPGEPFDIGPSEGDVLGVAGVEHDDVLNVRAAPGTDGDIIATLDPTAGDVVATGRARLLPRSIWYEVRTDGATGWASAAFLAHLGATDDITSRIVDGLGRVPTAETMADLGRIVAEEVGFDEPPSRITMTVAPSVGDLGEVTYDVVGFPDDAVLGARLHVFGQPTEEGFSLRSVEHTVLCRRGVTDDGLCV